MLEPRALAVTLQVTTVLDSLDIPYVVGGSLASIVHGLVRTTMDADIIADLHQEQVPSFLAALDKQFYVPDEFTIQEAIRLQRSFNLIHLDTMFKVDIFLPGDRDFDRQQLSRRIAEQVGTRPNSFLWVLSSEDVVLAKLDWFRLGGEVSERQWRDVVGVIKSQQANLDADYLRHWARNLGVLDLLEQALEEAGTTTE